MEKPGATLFMFSGLSGVGKTTLARALAAHLRVAYLRIDTVEQALRDLCGFKVEGEGYRLAYRIAAENLRLGLDVVADCVNPVTLTRDEWGAVAHAEGARICNIEVLCSDPDEHRQRVEGRANDIAGLALPGWNEVMQREFHAWRENRLRIDTARRGVAESLAELLRRLPQARQS
ncbi:MAG: kinase [Candidatus Dactylopiibacterium carminicum]|uniref:Kinase n=1 Tax=Candidatus Dactylopiibacterium carminicum TaxID=857335 RepID=A0A272EPA4_9RHOO|nr:AAA family ATPase [Candidatus Dactylopiibacterium carminicum]KAF7597926.1 kinase [Candidatus Dactylopiibacterium carminicum]PAS91500.1 MAG: kinase [Candidatus Dactylopiibacterium carminicum]PAS93046.1 MAG: kinase [Candidatus Dactylopiibacterium carminicum]PAS96026.1 MAG: kinase [Candidatus Dactylopiibacterium carminicum]